MAPPEGGGLDVLLAPPERERRRPRPRPGRAVEQIRVGDAVVRERLLEHADGAALAPPLQWALPLEVVAGRAEAMLTWPAEAKRLVLG